MKLKRALPAKDNIPSREAPFFATATSQSPGVPETLATAYNPGMRLWALPVIDPRNVIFSCGISLRSICICKPDFPHL